MTIYPGLRSIVSILFNVKSVCPGAEVSIRLAEESIFEEYCTSFLLLSYHCALLEQKIYTRILLASFSNLHSDIAQKGTGPYFVVIFSRWCENSLASHFASSVLFLFFKDQAKRLEKVWDFVNWCPIGVYQIRKKAQYTISVETPETWLMRVCIYLTYETLKHIYTVVYNMSKCIRQSI